MSRFKPRKPTGKVAWPMLLVEGEEKAGKTYAALALSADDRVGRTFAFDMGEGTVDEYAALGRYEVVPHDGTFSDLLAMVKAATKAERDDGKPNVIVIDSMTAVWDAIKDGLTKRARASRSGRKKLAEDPDADVVITQDLWNSGKDQWGRLIHTLRYWDGISVLIAHGKPTQKVDGSNLVLGYAVESEKNLPKIVTGWVRMSRPHTATAVGWRSLTQEPPSGGLVLPDAAPLAYLVFDILGKGGEFGTSSAVAPTVEWDKATAKNQLVDVLRDLGSPDPVDAAKALWESTVPDDCEGMTDDLWARLEDSARDLVSS